MVKKRRRRPYTIHTIDSFKKKYLAYKSKSLVSGNYFLNHNFDTNFEAYMSICKLCKRDATHIMVPYNRRIFINQEFYWSDASFSFHNYPFPGNFFSLFAVTKGLSHNDQTKFARELWWNDLIKGSYIHPMCSEACINIMILMNQG